MTDNRQLTDRDWKSLLREIHSGQVIPVIGPGLVTVMDEATQTSVPLHKYLAPDLASALELAEPDRFSSYNYVAREYLLGGGERKELYIALGEILDRLKQPPSQALLDLAAITDFSLFVAATPDPLLASAVAKTRPGFSPDRGVTLWQIFTRKQSSNKTRTSQRMLRFQSIANQTCEPSSHHY